MRILTTLLLLAPGAAWASSVSVPAEPTAVVPPVDQIVVPDDAPEGLFFDIESSSSPAIGTGPSQRPPRKNIVNGVDAGENEFPEVVYLEISGVQGSSESSCTGSLIHPRWVLTAAHCIVHAGGGTPAAVRVRFGNVAADPTLTVDAVQWIAHEKWDPEESSFEYDIALIKLATEVHDVFPMALNSKPMDASWVGREVRFIGFGITRWQGGGGGIKRWADERIHAVPDTRPYLVQTFDGEHSTCQGDSGGPSVLFSGTGYSQVSVTSHGPECGKGPSGHMRVDHYLPWITQKMAPDQVITRAAAPPTFVCNRRINSDDPNSQSIGVLDFDLACSVIYSPRSDLTGITWNWGDGEYDSVPPDQVTTTHTYTKPGNFTVQMCATGKREDSAGNEVPWEHCVTKSRIVQACGLPDVAFDVVQEEGLRYRFENLTDIRTSFGCIYNVQWDIFEGDTTEGEPFDSIVSWDPEYEFPSAGEYTVVLNVGGIAGTAAAKATFRARASGGENAACDTTGLGAAGVILAGLAAAAVRRRRRVA